MTTSYDRADLGPVQELRKLNLKTRNRVRAILVADTSHSIELFNRLRHSRPAGELLQVQRVLRQYALKADISIPELFPRATQTSEAFHRLAKLGLCKKLEILEGHIREHYARLAGFFSSLKALNTAIISRDLHRAARLIPNIVSEFGHSHFLIRKATLIRCLNQHGNALPEVEHLLIEALSLRLTPCRYGDGYNRNGYNLQRMSRLAKPSPQNARLS
jgi:hypothetical protein